MIARNEIPLTIDITSICVTLGSMPELVGDLTDVLKSREQVTFVENPGKWSPKLLPVPIR